MTIPEFIATAERVTRMQLDELFDIWLFTPSKPEGIETASALTARAAGALGRLPARLPKR